MLTEHEFMSYRSSVHGRLRSYALRLCRDRTQADDLMQQTALQAWSARDRLPSVNSVIAWFVVILRNCHYEVLRRRRFEVDDPDGAIADTVATESTHEARIEIKSRVARARDRLQALECGTGTVLLAERRRRIAACVVEQRSAFGWRIGLLRRMSGRGSASSRRLSSDVRMPPPQRNSSLWRVVLRTR